MRVAITGAGGLFGRSLVAAFATRHEAVALTRADADITDAQAVRSLFDRIRPNLVVHPAAIADIDICEADPALAEKVNVQGTRNVVEAALRVDAAVVHISTDAVFDGTKTTPYVETDPTGPITVYGHSKLRAEKVVQSIERHWIFRIPVLFGPGKANFVEKGLRKLAAGDSYKVASDQLGCAMHTLDGALKIMELAESSRFGLYHLGNQGSCTRLELAYTAAEAAGLNSSLVLGVPDALMQRRAPRLEYAVLEMRALRDAGFALPRSWQESLVEYVRTLKL